MPGKSPPFPMTGRHMRDHTDVVIHSAETEIVRLVNLPKPTKTMLEWTVDQNEQYCRENHNACFLNVTNRPYYALLSCNNIGKGKTIQAYYGPASGFLLGQYVNEKFLC